jgi:hypothetical protein
MLVRVCAYECGTIRLSTAQQSDAIAAMLEPYKHSLQLLLLSAEKCDPVWLPDVQATDLKCVSRVYRLCESALYTVQALRLSTAEVCHNHSSSYTKCAQAMQYRL